MSKLTKSDLTGVFVVSLLFLGIFFVNRSVDSAENPRQENKQLQQRVAELEKRIEQLEVQLRLKSPQVLAPPAIAPVPGVEAMPQLQFVPTKPNLVPVAPVAPSTPNLRVPQDWQQKEINGIQYFVIPIETNE